MDTYTVSVHALSHDGRGIARLQDNRVVFIPHALPGQSVTVALTKEHPQYAEASIVRIEAEEGLREPLCAEALRCGGCPLQRLPRSEQLYWKERLVKDTLIKISHISAETIRPIRADSKESGFRNKMEFAFGHKNGEKGVLLGLREEGSRLVHGAEGCVLLPPYANAIRKDAEEFFSASDLAAYDEGGILRHLVVRYGIGAKGLEWWLVCLTGAAQVGDRRKVQRVGEKLLAAHPEIAGFVHEERRKKDALAIGEKRLRTLCRDEGQTATLTLPLGGLNFYLDATSFFQVHLAAANLLVDAALDELPNFETLLDCYCGVGAPGLILAKKGQGKTVHGFESHARSVRYAKINAERFGIDALYTECRLEKETIGYAGDPKKTLVLLDPPRSGLAPKTVASLTTLKPANILYLSCNPATLARDILRLADAFTLNSVVPVDLFPHSAHIECLARFCVKQA
ncbi:MAG: 23S rRNA (uracil(1939)-C(5))-methyltransferase RlmD [Desulfovibrionaceae bacterium]|nr:23S rRNA (uracil(1939)-C(5))-methyltransferase RlmD [Desulfovibrionaceae bacterium]